MASGPVRPPIDPKTHRTVLWLVGTLTAVILVLTAGVQIYDANLYVMAEATALLAGDRPGRDFFGLGMPLELYLATAAQLASGGRLIGEFLRQWLYILAGVIIAFHLGLRLSRSVAATLAVLVPTLVILANTPTYHASKLLFFPLFTWVAWRYLDAPGVRRSAIVGAVTAAAFLTRHDYGVYLGFGSVVAWAVGRLATQPSRQLSAWIRDAGAYAAAVLVVLAPWAASVQTTEGLVEYARMRALLFESPKGTPYAALLDLHPIRTLTPEPLPAAEPAFVQFVWRPDIDEGQRQDLERRYRLRLLEGRDDRDRLRYEVPTAYDLQFLELEPYIRDPTGIPWDRLREARARLPSQASVSAWLQQVALAIPLMLIAAGGLALWRYRRDDRLSSADLSRRPVRRSAKREGGSGEAAEADAWRMIVAGALLAVINGSLFREPGYVVVTVPLTAALSARFLVGAAVTGRAGAILVLLLTTFAAVVWARRSPIFLPSELGAFMSTATGRLLASPPVAGEPKYRYLYECTAPGDRLLITGATPSLVSYYANRPIAGGHSYWHHGWLSDPVSEARSLELLQRQSVPFLVSTHDPVMDDFETYPRIREYLEGHYTPLEGTNGTILVDTRRRPTGRFGPLGYPCFR